MNHFSICSRTQSKRWILAAAMLAVAFSTKAGTSDFRFERLWPPLQQPWYFFNVQCLTATRDGHFFVCDRLRKFAGDGRLVGSLVLPPVSNGSTFFNPRDIEIDADGRVFVLDSLFSTPFPSRPARVARFDANGVFEAEFDLPSDFTNYRYSDIEFDDETQTLYALDHLNHQVYRLDVSGAVLDQWGQQGSGATQFSFSGNVSPQMQVAGNRLYLADSDNNRIQVYDRDGNHQMAILLTGLTSPESLLFDADAGQLLVKPNIGIPRIQVYTQDGTFVSEHQPVPNLSGRGLARLSGGRLIASVQSARVVAVLNSAFEAEALYAAVGDAPGRFNNPGGVLVDSLARIWVTDQFNARVQVFNPSGQHQFSVGPDLGGGISLSTPYGIVQDADGYIYVSSDQQSRLYKFDADGNYITRFGNPAGGTALDSELFFPRHLALDTEGNLYVAGGSRNFVQRFNRPSGSDPALPHTFRALYGSSGSGPGQLNDARGVAISPATGNLYVADHLNRRVQVFDIASQDQVLEIPECHQNFQFCFDKPETLVFLPSGDLLVTDNADRVFRFDSNHQFVSISGERGVGPGQTFIQGTTAPALTAEGKLVVADRQNQRVQVLSNQPGLAGAKAIVVTGGGPYPGNGLWDATRANANFAFRVLASQGYTKSVIQYLSAETGLDLDQNGLADEVDADATVAALQDAVLGNFASDAQNLLLYLVDHGGEDTFRMSGTETLSAAELGGWLDSWQTDHPGSAVTIIYDACQSGSFLDDLRSDVFDRMVIASTGSDQSAYFVSQGALSFSNQFWTHIFNGLSLGDAFNLASQSQNAAFPLQQPLLESDGDGTANSAADLALAQLRFIGNGTAVQDTAPTIGSVTPPQTLSGTNSALITASGVTDDGSIDRVWAVLRPPGFGPASPSNPISDLPTFELPGLGGNSYGATFAGFSEPGTYQLTVYALDDVGNTAVPAVTTVTVDNPLNRRAIILAGGESSDGLSGAIVTNADSAYRALEEQGYGDDGGGCSAGGFCDLTCDNVCYLSSVASLGFDATPTLANLQSAITQWGVSETQDLTLFIAAEEAGGGYRVNQTETLTATNLKSWLDTAQAAIAGTVSVIIEGSDGENFISQLTPAGDDDRILISATGAGESAVFLDDGQITFSRYFWTQVLNGATVRSAFNLARQAMTASTCPQSAQIDDNGNGITNELVDGLRSASFAIGSGVLLAGDEPLIGDISPPATVTGTGFELFVEDVTTTAAISKVVATIRDQNGCEQSRLLADQGNGRWATSLPGIDLDTGLVDISVYAVDINGAASVPATTSLMGDRIFFDDFE